MPGFNQNHMDLTPISEIAEKMGLKYSTVQGILANGMRKLRMQVKENPELRARLHGFLVQELDKLPQKGRL